MSVTIFDVEKNSYAEKSGIKKGEKLVSINDNIIIDVLDYRFYQLNRNLSLVIEDENGSNRTVTIKKPEYDEIGLQFETYLMDKQRSCRNKCVFCFIDQLPKGLRDTLYFKDDDSRLSFLFGNYITLTNITEHEISRIIKMHISPINISVHTTNPELRCKMMGNRFAGESLKHLYRLAEAGIQINCQIVACPGINDGEELVKTLTDLKNIGVANTAVVPVGLTRYRENLTQLEPYNKETAKKTLETVESFGEQSLKETGRRVFYAGDEFYIMSGKKIPSAEFYEDFALLENGVGLVALLRDEVDFALSQAEGSEKPCHTVSIACGTSAAVYLKEIAESINTKYPNIKIKVYPIKNDFFGGGVNVSGLVVGKDLITQLKNKDLGDRLLIPSVMLRFERDIFLDDTSLEDVKSSLDIDVIPVDNDGQQLLDSIIKEI